MPVIPRFDQRVGQSLDTMSATPVGQLYVPPARRSALEDLGQGIQVAAGQVGKVFQAEQERRAAEFTTSASASLQESAIRQMNEAKQQSLASGQVDGFADGFLESFRESVNTTLESAPNPMAREMLAHRMEQAGLSLYAQAANFETTTRTKIARDNLAQSMESYAKSAVMDPTQVPQILKQIDGDVEGAAATIGLVDARKAGEYYKTQVIATAASDMMQDNPIAAMSFIDRYQDVIPAKEYVALKKGAEAQARMMEVRAQKAFEERQDRNEVWGAINGGIPVDPTNPKVQKSVEEMYLMAKEQDPNVDFTNIVEATQVMPKSMASDMVASLANGTPEQQVKAARQIQTFHSRMPYLVDKIPSAYKAQATMIAELAEAGVPTSKAIEWSKKQVSVIDSQVLKMREAAFKKEDLTFDAVERELSKWHDAGIDAIPEAMRAEYNVLAKGYYVNEGLDAAQAQKNALSDIKGRWHPSTVTGRARYMKYAPETVYNNEYGSAWIKDSLIQDIERVFPFHPDPKDVAERSVLEANPYPDREGNIVYNLYMFDKDTGMLDVLYRPNGEPFIFKPVWEKSPQYNKMLENYQGQTWEERRAAYLKDTEEKRAKQERWGQDPVWGWTSAALEGGF
jgi:hypothetical protein